MASSPAPAQRARDWPVERRADLLAGVPPFARLPAGVLRAIAAQFHPRAVTRSSFVFREGDRADTVNVAAVGRLKIVRETVTGRQVILRLIRPGELFGVSGGWGTTTYPASACALDQALVLQLPATEFARLLATYPELSLAVIRDLGAKLREAEARILDLETAGVEVCIARVLLRLTGQVPPAPASTTIALTRQDLADLAGTTLSTASRTLAAWHRQGIVAALRERVNILNPAVLLAIAEEE